jgi:hypothetical protein
LEDPIHIASSHLRALPRWTSDSFGVAAYAADRASWHDAIMLTAGENISHGRQLRVTSPDGVHSKVVDRDAINASAHEAQLTISADWFVGEDLDGYVTSSFSHADTTSLEHFTFGTLDATRFQFVDALLAHFVAVTKASAVAMLAISAVEDDDAAEDRWRMHFRNGGELITDLLVVTTSWTGQRPTHALTLATTAQIEIYARTS